MVPRMRLIEQLNRDFERPLTLVSAPTGYGKSILVAQWIERCKQPTAWFSLDEKDNDLPLFLNYIFAAIEQVFPGECQNCEMLLHKTPLPEIDEICTILINHINQIQKRFILVLDDFQVINNANIHDLIKELMQHPSRNMHLVMICRSDPPLPLIQYLSKNLMSIISTEALRFTTDETSELLAKCIPGRFDENVVEPLVNKMEGWITGISLTILSLFEDQHLSLEKISNGTAYYIREYLTKEFSKNIQPEIAQYLLECSVLDKFCLPLVNNIDTNKTDIEGENKFSATEFMLDLDKSHLLINCVDCNNRWCSLHPLFKDFLQNKMADEWSEEDLAKLQQSAGKWVKKNVHNKEAINRSYIAGDKNNIYPNSEKNKDSRLNEGKWADVEKWLAEIPEGTKKNHPITLPSVKLTFKTASGAYNKLTKRESEVLTLIAQGKSNKEIASALYLSTETIKKHIYRIFQKFDTHSRTETIRKASEIGILP